MIHLMVVTGSVKMEQKLANGNTILTQRILESGGMMLVKMELGSKMRMTIPSRLGTKTLSILDV